MFLSFQVQLPQVLEPLANPNHEIAYKLQISLALRAKLNHQFHVLLHVLEIVVISILHLAVRHHPDKLVLRHRFFLTLWHRIEIILGFGEEGLDDCVSVHNDHELFIDLRRLQSVLF